MPDLHRLWEDVKSGKVTDFEAAQALGKLRTKFAKPELLTPRAVSYPHVLCGQS